jgi:hypothetical protein
MSGFRVIFSRVLLGVHFPVFVAEVRRARDMKRALRAAELRFEGGAVWMTGITGPIQSRLSWSRRLAEFF